MINKDYINKIVNTLFIVHIFEISNQGTNSRILKDNGLLDIAIQLEKEGLLVSGHTYNGKTLENIDYYPTIFGSDFLIEYGIAKGIIPETKKEESYYQLMHHSV